VIKLTSKGSFTNSERFFKKGAQIGDLIRGIMDRYGAKGIEALEEATPKATGKTSRSWSYKINTWGLAFYNDNLDSSGTPIAVLIQFGHGTPSGAYVAGRDYINPALSPIFDQIAEEITKEVQGL